MWVGVVKNSLPKERSGLCFQLLEVIFKPLEDLPSESVSVCQEVSATEWSNNVICEGRFGIMPYQF